MLEGYKSLEGSKILGGSHFFSFLRSKLDHDIQDLREASKCWNAIKVWEAPKFWEDPGSQAAPTAARL